ncbi:MAG: hypothetical protein AAF968_25825 [Pseudomonadota bacterium]
MLTGLIDCTVTYGYFASATKLDELITTITPIELSSSIVLATVMNKDVFESLSGEDQAAIREAAGLMHDYYGEHLGQAEAEAIDAMTSGDDGLVLKSFSDADTSVLGESAQPIVEKWLADADATGLNGQEILNEMLSLVEKWNEIEATQGVPWDRS